MYPGPGVDRQRWDKARSEEEPRITDNYRRTLWLVRWNAKYIPAYISVKHVSRQSRILVANVVAVLALIGASLFQVSAICIGRFTVF